MKTTVPIVFLGLLAIVLLPAGSPAQAGPRYGDLIVSGYSPSPAYTGVFAVDLKTLRIQTLRFMPSSMEVDQWVGMMDDNLHIGLLTRQASSNQGFLYGIHPGGGSNLLGTIKTQPPNTDINDPTSAIWDPEGRLLITAGRAIYRYDPGSPGKVYPVFNFPGTIGSKLFQGVTVGPGQGGNFKGTYYLLNARPLSGTPIPAPPYFYRFDPVAVTITTLTGNKMLENATSVSFQYGPPTPTQKRFFMTRGRPGSNLWDLLSVDFNRMGISTLARFTSIIPSAHKVTLRNTAWVTGAASNMQTSHAIEIDLGTGAKLRTVPLQPHPGFLATGIEEFKTNLLQTRGRAFQDDAPLVFDLQTNDNTYAGKDYVLGLSFESSPPIPFTVGTTTVYLNLAIDPLLMVSLFNPGAIGLSNSWGTLDANGNAQAILSLPPSIPSTGLSIYAAWVVYEGSTVLLVSEAELFVLP